METRDIFLGYEVGTGHEVNIPLRHLCVTGQTQEAGKTTALEALIARSGKKALAFVTKRGERSFESGRRIPPYFHERADWEFIESILEAIMRQRMKFERAWIVRACRGAHTLADVRRNVAAAMDKAKRSMDADIYMLLGEYLDKVIPLLARLPKSDCIDLRPGLNVMDLRSYPDELQMLIVSSSVRWIHQREEGVETILPEAWKFAPQGRNTPVIVEVRKIAREGAGLKNYLWVDSQDIAGVEKEILRAAAVWLIGVQREANEIERALKSIPKGIKRPSAGEIPTLGLGEFFVCWGDHVKKVYVQPVWMEPADARAIAMGKRNVRDFSPPRRTEKNEEENVDFKAAYEEAMQTIQRLEAQVRSLEQASDRQRQSLPSAKPAPDSVPTEEVAMSIDVKRPVIDVTVRKYSLELDDENTQGRIAILLSEGFIENPKRIQDFYPEFRARGWMKQTGAPTPLNLSLAKLTEMGFLRMVGTNTYQAVPGMKVNVKEVAA